MKYQTSQHNALPVRVGGKQNIGQNEQLTSVLLKYLQIYVATRMTNQPSRERTSSICRERTNLGTRPTQGPTGAGTNQLPTEATAAVAGSTIRQLSGSDWGVMDHTQQIGT